MRTKKNDVRPLILLGIFVLLLVVSLSLSVRQDNIAAGSFRLSEITLCEDLDDNLSPLERKTSFSGDTKQVCLWFEYERARDGDQVEVQWKFEKDDIQRESFRLEHARGTRAFYLLKEDGSALSPGTYEVSILCNGRMKGRDRFAVEPLPDASFDEEDEAGEETESADPLSFDISLDLAENQEFS